MLTLPPGFVDLYRGICSLYRGICRPKKIFCFLRYALHLPMIIIFRRQEIPIPNESVKHGPISTGMDEQFVHPLEGASIALTEKGTHTCHASVPVLCHRHRHRKQLSLFTFQFSIRFVHYWPLYYFQYTFNSINLCIFTCFSYLRGIE